MVEADGRATISYPPLIRTIEFYQKITRSPEIVLNRTFGLAQLPLLKALPAQLRSHVIGNVRAAFKDKARMARAISMLRDFPVQVPKERAIRFLVVLFGMEAILELYAAKNEIDEADLKKPDRRFLSPQFAAGMVYAGESDDTPLEGV